MPDNPMICIEHLKKIYGSGASAVAALDDVSLTIRKGDIHGIIGMSGAGKSTLIRCINRLDTPTEGRILIDGQDILAMNDKNLGIVTAPILALLAFAFSAALFLGTLIIGDRRARTELRRRFHVR